MIQILLLTALAIAIVLDIIRIWQFIAMRKLLDEDAKLLAKAKFEKRVKTIIDKWRNDRNDHSEVEDYIINHWEDEN